MPPENNTNPSPLQATLARAQEHASQLLRAAHEAANAIDRAVAAARADGTRDPSVARLARLRAYGAAQDAKVLARRFLDTLAGVEPAELVRERITVGVFRSRCFADSELLSDCAAELARDVAMEVLALCEADAKAVAK